MVWSADNLVLLAFLAAFDIVLDECRHAWPIDVAFSKAISFLFSRVATCRVIVVFGDNIAAELKVFGDNYLVLECYQGSIGSGN